MFNNKLKKKIVLITGASSGIGKATALQLIKEGYIVYGAARHLDKMKDLEKLGGIPMQMDITKDETISEGIDRIIKEQGRIDVLVNNAGVLSSYSVVDLKEQEWDRIILINLKGVYLMTKIVLKHMIPRKVGKIINIASDCGISGKANLSHYCSSKFGVVGFTQSVAKEVAKYNILVNAVCPGPTHTDLHFRDLEMQSKNSGISKDNLLASELEMIPLGRLAKPEEIARLVVFLASDENTYITGESINISGGFEVH